MKSDPGLYDYFPYVDRPRITWPGGARVAYWVAPNIEFYELDPPVNPIRKAWPRPAPRQSRTIGPSGGWCHNIWISSGGRRNEHLRRVHRIAYREHHPYRRTLPYRYRDDHGSAPARRRHLAGR